MSFQPTFWTKFSKACAQQVANFERLRPHIDELTDPRHSADPGLSDQMLARLFTTFGRLPNAVELGFLIGERMPMTAFGVWSIGLLTAPTLDEALQFVADTRHGLLPLIRLAYEADKTEGRLTIGFRCPIDDAGEALVVAIGVALIEFEVARWRKGFGNLARLELRPSSNTAAVVYQDRLKLTPKTDCKANVLVFDRAVLDLPNPCADLDTFDSVRRAVINAPELEDCDPSLRHRVRTLLMANIDLPPSLDHLAKMMEMHPRRLRRCLTRERTSYQEILRECRIAYVCEWLPKASLSRIADRLGYSDLSAFSHAFFRWTGKSPTAFRNELCSGN